MQIISEYIRAVMVANAAAGNELLRLNMSHVAKELGIKEPVLKKKK